MKKYIDKDDIKQILEEIREEKIGKYVSFLESYMSVMALITGVCIMMKAIFSLDIILLLSGALNILLAYIIEINNSKGETK